MPLQRRTVISIGLFASVLCASAAFATVTMPDGTIVPRDQDGNDEAMLSEYFADQGEAIDWQADANTTPAVFSPLCAFTATFVVNISGVERGLSWYNVDPTRTMPPGAADLHEIVAPGSPVGTVVDSVSIRTSPDYTGGLVGFAITGGQLHYSELQWNVTCTACSTPGPWPLAVIYKSKNLPNAYYLAFEDGEVDFDSYGNDGDYNDQVFLLTGLACDGAGVTCDTGNMGICAAGITSCGATGALGCEQAQQPSAEQCNGVDDDCDGEIDNGATCQADFTCVRGVCTQNCGGSEFPCDGALTCDNGVCVTPACVGVDCTGGQVCIEGECRGGCEGVVCPVDQVCRIGRCVDPCAGVVCGAMKVCAGGVCIDSCECLACGSGATCSEAIGKCVETACANMTCSPGNICVAGACVDACTGVVCPFGQECKAGACVDLPVPDMAGGSDDGGSGGSDLAAGTSDGGNTADGAASADGGGGTDAGDGCNCRAAGAPVSDRLGALLLVLVTGLLLRRRRAY